MNSAYVLGGRFHVFADGRINRVTENGEEPAKTYPCSRYGRYLMVAYTDDGQQVHVYVHRLVAEAFIPNPRRYPQVNHLDGNPRNNAADNLEWVTASMNMRHARRIGLMNDFSLGKTCRVCGAKCGNSNSSGLCPACAAARPHLESRQRKKALRTSVLQHVDIQGLPPDKQEIIKLWGAGITYREIGDKLGVSRQAVFQVVQRVLAIGNEEKGCAGRT